MTDYRAPNVPKDLGTGGKRIWRTVTAEWSLTPESEELIVLEHACRAQDLADRAQQVINERGFTAPDRFGVDKEIAEVRILRQQRSQVVALLKAVAQSQIQFRRLEIANANHERIEADRDKKRDRRGGGKRRIG